MNNGWRKIVPLPRRLVALSRPCCEPLRRLRVFAVNWLRATTFVVVGARIAVVLLLLSFAARAQQRPLVTEDVEIVKPGSVRFELGFDFVQDRNFTLSGLNGDLTRLGIVSLTFGLAPNVEVEAGGVMQNYLSINRAYQPSRVPLRLSAATNSTHDTGDFYLATKIKLRQETRRLPSIGFRFGAELPNSNQTRGIGLNQTNFFATVLAAKNITPRLRVHSSLGLGILTAPVDAFTQNDVLLYGLAASYRWNDRLTLVGEVNGRYSTRNNPPVGTQSDGAARLGARIRAAGLLWDVAGIRGLHRASERSGIAFGVSYEANLFQPIK